MHSYSHSLLACSLALLFATACNGGSGTDADASTDTMTDSGTSPADAATPPTSTIPDGLGDCTQEEVDGYYLMKGDHLTIDGRNARFAAALICPTDAAHERQLFNTFVWEDSVAADWAAGSGQIAMEFLTNLGPFELGTYPVVPEPQTNAGFDQMGVYGGASVSSDGTAYVFTTGSIQIIETPLSDGSGGHCRHVILSDDVTAVVQGGTRTVSITGSMSCPVH